MTDALLHLLVLVVVSWVYLTAVRFVDVNEREPVWSLGIAFGLGGLAAALLRLVVSPVTLVLEPWIGALAEEVAKAVAYGGLLLAFAAVARMRGWFELTDVVDGIVYGIAVGLGFSVAGGFLAGLNVAGTDHGPLAFHVGPAIVNGALDGLRHGLLGGLTGLGIGLAVETRHAARRPLLALAGLTAAVAANAGFRELAHGNSLGGDAGLLRTWLAALIPLAALVAIGLIGLARERRGIVSELTPEVATGLLDSEDLALLQGFWRRQLRYLGLLAAGRFHECLVAAARHNRLVQYALLKGRAARSGDPHRAAGLRRQGDALERVLRRGALPMALLALAGGLTALRQAGGQPNAGVQRVVTAASTDLDAYWRRQAGFGYATPRVSAYALTGDGCPYLRNNAVFCHVDGNIYYDPAFFNELHDSIGDFAPVLVLSHEWGHKMQSVRGESRVSGRWPIQGELQADCYAGEWVRSLDGTGKIEKGDLGEGLQVLNEGRDPRGYPWNDPAAHGTAGQRVDAFQAGRDGIDCRSDSLWTEIGFDTRAANLPEAPTRGSLLKNTARRKGRFEMADIRVRPDWLTPGMVDIVWATYRAPDGATVDIARAAMVSVERVEEEVRADSAAYVKQGYRVVNRGDVKDGDKVLGRWLLLSGTKQAVIISNRQIYEFVLAAEGIAWEFATASVPETRN